MEKKIEDYLHLYLGCQVAVLDVDGQEFTDKIESVYDRKSGKGFSIYTFEECPFDDHDDYYQQIKPLLRPLSSMTEEEKWELLKVIGYDMLLGTEAVDESFINKHASDKDRFAPICYYEATHYLLSKHFDLFELIESGFALDKTKI